MAEQVRDDINPFNDIDFSDVSGEKGVIEDFLSGTVTSKPEDVTEIKDETEEKKKVKTPEDKEEEKKKVKKEAVEATKKELGSFLNDGKEEESEEEEVEEQPKKVKKKVESKAEEVEEEEEEDEPKETNTFSILSKTLVDQGIFTPDEGEEELEIDTPEKFLQRFMYETEKKSNEKIEAFLGKFGEDYKAAFEAIYVNGADPREYFAVYNEIADIASLDMTLESNQEAVVKQALKEQGFEPEDIKVKLEKIKNYGDLEDESSRYHKVLLKNQSAKLAKVEETKKAQLQQQTAIKQQFVNNVTKTLEDKLKTKEFDGIPLNPKIAQELQDYLITDKWKTPQGETLTDFDKAILDLKRPENHQMKVKVALLLKTLEKDPTLQTIQKAGVTKETNKLFQGLTVKKEKSSVKEQKQSSAFANYL